MVKAAPSPPVTQSWPSVPIITVPIEWLGYCWHQSLTRTFSLPPAIVLPVPLPDTVRRDRRPLITQPMLGGLTPGGVGQVSARLTPPYVGAVPPIGASNAYRT